jgi:hypothetical protein
LYVDVAVGDWLDLADISISQLHFVIVVVPARKR